MRVVALYLILPRSFLFACPPGDDATTNNPPESHSPGGNTPYSHSSGGNAPSGNNAPVNQSPTGNSPPRRIIPNVQNITVEQFHQFEG